MNVSTPDNFSRITQHAAMRNALRVAAIQLSRLIPLRGLVRLANTPLVIYYHLVSDRALPHVRYLYEYKSARDFEKDLDYLLRTYRAVDLDDLLQASGKALPPRSVFVTFDDGLREAFEIASPVLKRKGIPAAFFLSSGFLDNKELFYRFKAGLLIERLTNGTDPVDELSARRLFEARGFPREELRSSLLRVTYRQRAILDEIARAWDVSFEQFLAEEKPYMSSDQAQRLLAEGFHLGGHSVDHPMFGVLSLEEQLFQTEECMRVLNARFKLKHQIFSFPFSARGVSDEYFRLAAEKGLAEAFFGTGGFGTTPGRRLFDRVSFDGMRSHSLKRKYLEYIRTRSRGVRKEMLL